MKNLSKSEMNAVLGGIGPKATVSTGGGVKINHEQKKSWWDRFVEIFVDSYRPY